MPLYSVMLVKPNPGISSKIRDTYKEFHYEISPTSFLIADTRSDVEKMAVDLGLDGTTKLQHEAAPPHGAVFVLKKGFYQGFASKKLWEWLNAQE